MITKSIKEQVMEYFFVNPTAKLRVRQLSRVVKVPLPSAIRYAKELEKEGILNSSEIAGVKFYSASRSSPVFLLEKKLFNIRSLLVLKDVLVKEFSNPTIVVFGSYSKGEDIERSDVDIFIESPSKKQVELPSMEKSLNRTIQFFRYKSIHDIKNKELANNIVNGIILNGYLKVFT